LRDILSLKETKPELYQELLRNDLSFFAEEILEMEIVGHHEEWSDLVSTYSERLALNAPRDHGKSYFFSFAYVVWRIYHNWLPTTNKDMISVPKDPLGYIFSNTEKQAMDFLQIIKREIYRNPKLKWLYPKKGEKWTSKDVVFSNGYEIRARGWGSSVRGGHPVWTVCDDVLTDDVIYSELQRDKQRDYFFSAITPMVVPSGQIVVIGTPFHQEDLYKSLETNGAFFFKRYAALDEKGEALWPTRYNKQTLEMRKQELGSTRFTREYLCVPISDESSLFPERVLRWNFDEEFEMPTQLSQAERNDIRIFTGVDFAMSANVGADYSVITTIGVDKYSNYWILDLRRMKGRGLTEQLKEIQDVYNKFKPQKILLETNQMQRIFLDELVRKTSLPVVGHNTGREKSSFELGVPSLQILFENRKFRIPRATERCRQLTDILVNELKSFTFVEGKLQGVGAHDDTVLSLWLTVMAARDPGFEFSFV